MLFCGCHGWHSGDAGSFHYDVCFAYDWVERWRPRLPFARKCARFGRPGPHVGRGARDPARVQTAHQGPRPPLSQLIRVVQFSAATKLREILLVRGPFSFAGLVHPNAAARASHGHAFMPQKCERNALGS